MIRRCLLGLLDAYRRWISPMMGPSCRFYPSCSDYAREAIERHGVWRGLGLGLRRVLRCHPYRPGGVDPVPPVEEESPDDDPDPGSCLPSDPNASRT